MSQKKLYESSLKHPTASSAACPQALFDTLEYINEQLQDIDTSQSPYPEDYSHALSFLQSYTGSNGTFTSYRREVERLLHWSWHIVGKSISQLQRDDMEAFVKFCQQPPKSWIGTKIKPRFVVLDGRRVPNPEWFPFVVKISKAQAKQGKTPNINDHELSQGAVREIFAILSTFYNYLIIENYATCNPVALIRQKGKFIRKSQGKAKIRRLGQLQWEYVLIAVEQLADEEPAKHERTLFMIKALYLLYLRISELLASERWTPTMNDFFMDGEQRWWFQTIGKGNKERQIAVSDAMLDVLKRWRKSLGLSALPTPADNSPLVPKIRGKGPMQDPAPIRRLVQKVFDLASENLRRDGFEIDADNLGEATVHWLRHTGISEDVKYRPREHVRDDAGHSSSAITDKYIDVELRERHRSAKDKKINAD